MTYPDYISDTDQYVKSYLNDVVKQCISGNKITDDCKDFVLKLWPSTLHHILLNHGPSSHQWESSIDMFCELIESIQPVNSVIQYRFLKNHHARILKANSSMLMLYNNDVVVSRGIRNLKLRYQTLLDQCKLINHRNLFSDNSHTALPRSIKPGIWCEIHIDNDTPKLRLKLSFINAENNSLVFVNRIGIKVLEKKSNDFVFELEKGLSKIYNFDAIYNKQLPSKQLFRNSLH